MVPARPTFETELRILQDDLLAMADLVGRAIGHAIRALVEHDADQAQQVVGGDERINGLWSKVERETLELIATQQPLATDLREILAMSAVATDLERMGDHAKGIASVALRMMEVHALVTPTAISKMADLVVALLNLEIAALIDHDDAAARAVAERDNEIDALYQQAYRELITAMTRNPQAISQGERLLWVAKSLERMGDHVTNIGERVVFVKTGEIVELNG